MQRQALRTSLPGLRHHVLAGTGNSHHNLTQPSAIARDLYLVTASRRSAPAVVRNISRTQQRIAERLYGRYRSGLQLSGCFHAIDNFADLRRPVCAGTRFFSGTQQCLTGAGPSIEIWLY
ncbi:hypothetical protein KCP74_06565 [Salmonella enterica subsp. enterica]|nr:hypothetical protein KCP74_06565 [Salmonella enterica subsp. enterica]